MIGLGFGQCPAAIMVAMTSGWLSHRTFTFALKTPPTVAEFLRYVAVGWFVSAVNYGLFVIILLLFTASDVARMALEGDRRSRQAAVRESESGQGS